MDLPYEDVIFSGIGTFDEGSPIAGTPFGFWIRFEADPENPFIRRYDGSIYISALGLGKHVAHVEGNPLVEISKDIVQMNVIAADGTIRASLRNLRPAKKDSQNTVIVDFVSPKIGSGTSTNAVVNVNELSKRSWPEPPAVQHELIRVSPYVDPSRKHAQ
jgi:hypothetical protein